MSGHHRRRQWSCGGYANAGGRNSIGFTLVELLVALPLTTLVAAAAALLLVRQAQHMRTAESRTGGGRELRHARLALETDLAPLRPQDIASISDSLIEFRAQLGIVRLCGTDPGGALTVSANESDRAWLSTVRAGDIATLWHWPVPSGSPPVAITTAITGPASAATLGRCGADSSQLRWTLPTNALAPGMRFVGAPAHIQRDTRYSHYRSGTHWWLGRRTRDASGWDGVQPVAGPLRNAVGRGMRVRAVDAQGNETLLLDSAAAIHVELRVTRVVTRESRATYDSAAFAVSLRGTPAGRRP